MEFSDDGIVFGGAKTVSMYCAVATIWLCIVSYNKPKRTAGSPINSVNLQEWRLECCAMV
jgi:hypothetical protein